MALQPKPSEPHATERFIVDEMLGKLARWLRLLGFDAEYVSPADDAELIRRSVAEDRVLLSRDRALLQCKAVRRSLWIRSVHLMDQLRQVAQELELPIVEWKLFTRCMECNSAVERLEAPAVAARVPAYIYETQDQFHQCPRCHRIYWPGTHWQHALARLRENGILPDVERQ